MQKHTLLIAAALMLGNVAALAQVKEEIIIEKKKGGKAEKTVIVIDGDRVTINGKDARNFKGNIDLGGRVVISGDEVRITGNERGQSMSWATNGKRVRLGVATENHEKGALITEVFEGMPAKAAGLKEGDVITHLEGKSIGGAEALSTEVRKHKDGEMVQVDYLRNGKAQSTKAVLKESPEPEAFVFNYDDLEQRIENFELDRDRMNRGMEEFRMEMPRFRFERGPAFVVEGRRPRLGINVQDNEDGDGVLVNEVESGTAAAKAGLKQGDIITAVDGNEVKGLESLRQYLRLSEEGKLMKMSIKRGAEVMELEVRTPKRIEKGAL